MPFAAEDPQYRARIGAFVQGLQEQRYINGRNVRLDFRASAGSPRTATSSVSRQLSFSGGRSVDEVPNFRSLCCIFDTHKQKNRAKSLDFLRSRSSAVVLSNRDDLSRYQSREVESQCIPSKGDLSTMNFLAAMLMLPIRIPSALLPIECIDRDLIALIAPQASRMLSSEATSHRSPGE